MQQIIKNHSTHYEPLHYDAIRGNRNLDLYIHDKMIKVLKQISMDGIEFDNLKKKKVESFLVDIKV